MTLEQYRAREQRLLEQVRTEIALPPAGENELAINRYIRGSLGDPGVWDFNWNQTYVLQPAGEPIGGVLLLHGLTDSPYSLRSIGQALAGRGYHVVGLRLPGHGTAPCGTAHLRSGRPGCRHEARDERPACDARARATHPHGRLLERCGARGQLHARRARRCGAAAPCGPHPDLARDRHHETGGDRADPHRALRPAGLRPCRMAAGRV